MPEALVEIQPPRVDSSTLSGSWPEVKPRARPVATLRQVMAAHSLSVRAGKRSRTARVSISARKNRPRRTAESAMPSGS